MSKASIPLKSPLTILITKPQVQNTLVTMNTLKEIHFSLSDICGIVLEEITGLPSIDFTVAC
jgi:hypothetical protein